MGGFQRIRSVILFVAITLVGTSIAWSATATITTFQRGYVTSTGFPAGIYEDMRVGCWDASGGTNPVYRGFAWFDIPNEVRTGTITSANITVQVKDTPAWNNLLNYIDLRSLGSLTYDDFVNLSDNYQRYIRLAGVNYQDSITRSSTKIFDVIASQLSGMSQIGFSFRASPEDPTGGTGDDSNWIILNSPTLIIEYTPPSITVTSPNGGERWQREESKAITWTSSGSLGSYVEIDLYKGGSFNGTITSSTSNNGSYNWPISSSQAVGTDYIIRITSTSNTSYYDDSNNNFSITDLDVLSPNGGESWEKGRSYDITWVYSSGTGSSVLIALYKNENYVRDIIGSTSNDGRYPWNVDTDLQTGSDYQIRIWTQGGDDLSDNNFSITAQTQKVATPTISPNGGTFTDSTQVTLSCSTSGAAIRYTTNGSTPTYSSTLYSSPFTVSSSCTVRARAFRSGYTDSDIATANFTINSVAKVATPTISPNGGTFTGSTQVMLSCSTSGAAIHYTTNGSTPTSSSTLYSSPFTVSNSCTVRARAFRSGYTDSDIATANFVFYTARIGSIIGWGRNSSAQVTPPAGNDFVAIDAGHLHSIALKSDGSLVAWGYDQDGQVSNTPVGNDFVALAAGSYHSLALKSDGSLVAWGWDNSGQVSNTPPGNDFVAIAAGGYHGLALKSDGSIIGWGFNDDGRATPPAGNDFVAIDASYHSLALKSDGSIIGWGDNNDDGQATPPAGNDFVAIAAGGWHSLALKSDGSLVAWGVTSGVDDYGQVSNTPAGNHFVAVAAGWGHSLALKSDGNLVTWGHDNFGQVSNTPAGNDFIAVAAGGYHNVAIRASSEIGDFCGADFGPPDGYVDVWDLMQFADHWHTRTGEGGWDAKFDLTGPDFGDADGYVDVWDLMVFADHWHEGQKP